jgi:hypothetical protein
MATAFNFAKQNAGIDPNFKKCIYRGCFVEDYGILETALEDLVQRFHPNTQPTVCEDEVERIHINDDVGTLRANLELERLENVALCTYPKNGEAFLSNIQSVRNVATAIYLYYLGKNVQVSKDPNVPLPYSMEQIYFIRAKKKKYLELNNSKLRTLIPRIVDILHFRKPGPDYVRENKAYVVVEKDHNPKHMEKVLANNGITMERMYGKYHFTQMWIRRLIRLHCLIYRIGLTKGGFRKTIHKEKRQKNIAKAAGIAPDQPLSMDDALMLTEETMNSQVRPLNEVFRATYGHRLKKEKLPEYNLADGPPTQLQHFPIVEDIQMSKEQTANFVEDIETFAEENAIEEEKKKTFGTKRIVKKWKPKHDYDIKNGSGHHQLNLALSNYVGSTKWLKETDDFKPERDIKLSKEYEGLWPEHTVFRRISNIMKACSRGFRKEIKKVIGEFDEYFNMSVWEKYVKYEQGYWMPLDPNAKDLKAPLTEHHIAIPLHYVLEEVTMASTIPKVIKWLQSKTETDVIAVDSESSPVKDSEKIQLIQMADETKAFIIDVKVLRDTEQFSALQNAIYNTKAVLLGQRFDDKEFSKVCGQSGRNNRVHDIGQLMLMVRGLEKKLLNHSRLSHLVFAMTEKMFSKSSTMAFWHVRPLSGSEKAYALLDVIGIIIIVDKLRDMKPNRFKKVMRYFSHEKRAIRYTLKDICDPNDQKWIKMPAIGYMLPSEDDPTDAGEISDVHKPTFAMTDSCDDEEWLTMSEREWKSMSKKERKKASKLPPVLTGNNEQFELPPEWEILYEDIDLAAEISTNLCETQDEFINMRRDILKDFISQQLMEGHFDPSVDWYQRFKVY